MRRFLITLLILVAVGVRFYYFWYPLGRSSEITVDEAVYGVQAIQILEGQRPVFYPAQDYTGSFSAYLSAFLFKVFGVSAAALKLVPLIFSLGTVLIIYLLSRLILGETAAIFSLLTVALGTPFWNNWASRAGTGYVEATFLGGLILLLTLGIVRRGISAPSGFKGVGLGTGPPPINKEIFLLGLLSGFGFWVQPTVVYLILPSLIFLASNLGPSRLFRVLPIFLGGFLVGAAPVVFYNLWVRPNATTGALLKMPWGVRGALIKLITQGFPVLLGGRTSNSLVDFQPLISGAVYLSFAAAAVYFLKRSLAAGRQNGLFLLLLAFLTTISIFLLSSPFNQLSIEPRYVYSLYLIIPLVWASFLEFTWTKAKVVSVLLCLLLAVSFTLGLFRAGPVSFVDDYGFERLVSFLRQQKVSFAITTPAVGHRLMFYAKGAIKAQVRGGGITQARFEKINEEVTRARDLEPRLAAYVNLVGEVEERSFRDEAADLTGQGYSRQVVDGVFSVVWPGTKL